MKRQVVNSTAIKELCYNEKTVEAEFRDGSVYQYGGVAPEDYQTVITASSVGKAFNDRIKSRYPAKRIR